MLDSHPHRSLRMPSCRHLAAVLVFGGLAGLAACSRTPPPDPAAQQAAAAEADAARNLDTYRQLLRIHSDQMAVTLGKEIIARHPDSAAATEVMKTLPAIEKRWQEASEKSRLAGLWLYQVSPMAGGTQSTATIANSRPASGGRVRLVLRRHSDWGQSVFLYGEKPGFVCRGNCTLVARVDGKVVKIKAFAPSTGEPALMIRDDQAFLKLLNRAKTLEFDVTLARDESKPTLVYEVAGFDAARWVPLPGAGKT